MKFVIYSDCNLMINPFLSQKIKNKWKYYYIKKS